MKDRLGHGRFGAWLASEFGMTARTAERYMGAARLEIAEYDTVSELPPATMQALAAPSLPEAVRTVCLERLKAGVTMLPKDVAACAADVRSEARARREAERQIPRSKKSRAEAMERLDAAQRDREARTIRATVARQTLVEMIADDLSKRPEATYYLRQMSGWSITPEDLLDAIVRRVGDV